MTPEEAQMRATPFHRVRSPHFRTALRPLAVLGTVLLLWGCSEHEFHPPDSQERVAAAETVFAELRFDTLTWESTGASGWATRTTPGIGIWRFRRSLNPAGRWPTPWTESGIVSSSGTRGACPSSS